jgi:hypothetical protein
MKNNNALAVVGAVFLLLVVVWFATRDAAPKVGVKELKVAKIDKDAVTKIEVTIPGKETKKDAAAPDDGPVATTSEPAKKVVLEKDGSGFVVYDGDKADRKFAVDDAQLTPLLDAIGEFQTGDLVANKADKLAGLEIDDAKGLHVVITTAKGKALDLLFGRAAKGGGTTVRAGGSNEVFVAKGRLGALAKKEVAAWRKKAIVDQKADAFQTVTVARADGARLVVTGETKEEDVTTPDQTADAGTSTTKKKTTTWKLTEPASLPEGFRLDDAALGRLAGAVATLRAVDFADDATDATAGFDAAHTTITAKGSDGKDVVVHLGKKDDKGRVHARVDGDKQVYLVAEYAAKNLDKGLDDLRDLTLVTAKLDDVEKVTFTAGKTKVVVQKDGAAWKLVEPKTKPAELDLAQAGSVVAAALRLRATRIDATATDAGGADPAIEFVLKDGKKQSVRFGKTADANADDKAPPREVFVSGADGRVYVAAAGVRTRYEKPVELFKAPPPPPPGMGGMGGLGGKGLSGLESLPPDVRKKLEESLKKQQQ